MGVAGVDSASRGVESTEYRETVVVVGLGVDRGRIVGV